MGPFNSTFFVLTIIPGMFLSWKVKIDEMKSRGAKPTPGTSKAGGERPEPFIPAFLPLSMRKDRTALEQEFQDALKLGTVNDTDIEQKIEQILEQERVVKKYERLMNSDRADPNLVTCRGSPVSPVQRLFLTLILFLLFPILICLVIGALVFSPTSRAAEY